MENEFVWHARRFWIQQPTGEQHLGWNTRFEPCWIMKRTAKQVKILSPSFGIMYLNREKLEHDGKVYHSKVHEYFYAAHPGVDPEKEKRRRFEAEYLRLDGSDSLAIFGLKPGCSKDEIKRAYRRLARQHHPDVGGSHDVFIKIQLAYETAIKAVIGR